MRPVTHRQRQIVHLMAEGHSRCAIARQLAISPMTVKNTLKIVYRNLKIEYLGNPGHRLVALYAMASRDHLGDDAILLSPLAADIIALMAEGHSGRCIALTLNISHEYVKNCLTLVYLPLRSRGFDAPAYRVITQYVVGHTYLEAPTIQRSARSVQGREVSGGVPALAPGRRAICL
jgi:DNA-binding CsgD family transcriptional regulator